MTDVFFDKTQKLRSWLDAQASSLRPWQLQVFGVFGFAIAGNALAVAVGLSEAPSMVAARLVLPIAITFGVTAFYCGGFLADATETYTRLVERSRHTGEAMTNELSEHYRRAFTVRFRLYFLLSLLSGALLLVCTLLVWWLRADVPARQLVLDSLYRGSVYALLGLGTAAILRVTRSFDVHLAIVITAAPYLVMWSTDGIGLPLLLGVSLGVIGVASLGTGVEAALYSQLRRAKAPALLVFLASLGVFVAANALLALIAGEETQSIRPVDTLVLSAGGARINAAQAVAMLLMVAVVTILHKALHTVWGRKSTAVADDEHLAGATGISARVVVYASTAVGCALLGLTGVLLALDQDFTPHSGFAPLLIGYIIALAAGGKTPLRVVFSGLIFGSMETLSEWYLGSTWKTAIPLLCFIALLSLSARLPAINWRVKRALSH